MDEGRRSEALRGKTTMKGWSEGKNNEERSMKSCFLHSEWSDIIIINHRKKEKQERRMEKAASRKTNQQKDDRTGRKKDRKTINNRKKKIKGK